MGPGCVLTHMVNTLSMTTKVNFPFTLKPSELPVSKPHALTICEWLHQTIMGMLSTAEIDLADIVNENDITDFLTNDTSFIYSFYNTVLKVTAGVAVLEGTCCLTSAS